MTLAPEYLPPMKRSSAAQFLLLMVSSLMMDGGFAMVVLLIATAAYWAGFVLIAIRRPQSPRRFDLFWADAGFVVTFVATLVAGLVVMSVRGEL